MGKKSKNKHKKEDGRGQRPPQQRSRHQQPRNDIVLGLYDDPPHCGDVFYCTNCFKDEPPGVEFRVCSACEAVQYCSRECQVAHWKSHKKRCQKPFEDERFASRDEDRSLQRPSLDDEQKKSLKKIDGRVHRFKGYFGPMIDQRLLTIQFALLQMDHGTTAFPRDHVVTLSFSELPESAKKPRLRLDGVSTLEFTKLPDKYRKHMKHGMRSFPPGAFVIPFVWSVTFSRGSCQGTQFGPGVTGYAADPLLRVPRGSKELLSMECENWVRIINSLAEGGRPDLFRAIKEKIKANRAQSRSHELRWRYAGKKP